MTVARNRLDTELVRRGLATSRTQAREFIESRRVQIAKVVAAKPATQVETSGKETTMSPAGLTNFWAH